MCLFSRCYTPVSFVLLCFFLMKDYFCIFSEQSWGCWSLPSFLNLTFPLKMKWLLLLLVWNQVQDNMDWNSDRQSPPFEMKMFFSNTTAFPNPPCFKCTSKWGNLFLPMRCIILRELLIFAVLQLIGCPISSSMASSGIIRGQWEKIHYTGNFPHFCSEKLYRDLER